MVFCLSLFIFIFKTEKNPFNLYLFYIYLFYLFLYFRSHHFTITSYFKLSKVSNRSPFFLNQIDFWRSKMRFVFCVCILFGSISIIFVHFLFYKSLLFLSPFKFRNTKKPSLWRWSEIFWACALLCFIS